MRWLLHAKIHKATVTAADVDYVGSITIDKSLMEAVDLWEGERVLVVSTTSGERLETYAIPGKANSGAIEMNGAAALRIRRGEEIIVMAFRCTAEPVSAKVALVDKNNRFVGYAEKDALDSP
jgi:aspartate 1-decarboxylase